VLVPPYQSSSLMLFASRLIDPYISPSKKKSTTTLTPPRTATAIAIFKIKNKREKRQLALPKNTLPDLSDSKLFSNTCTGCKPQRAVSIVFGFIVVSTQFFFHASASGSTHSPSCTELRLGVLHAGVSELSGVKLRCPLTCRIVAPKNSGDRVIMRIENIRIGKDSVTELPKIWALSQLQCEMHESNQATRLLRSCLIGDRDEGSREVTCWSILE